MGTAESEEAAALLKSIGDFERISDHAVNTLESAEELRDKNLTFSPSAVAEFSVLAGAVSEILDLSLACFEKNDSAIAAEVEPLEQVIDQLKESMRTRHIRRLQQGGCSIELGFILSDLLTGLERTSDHCSNIAGCVIDTATPANTRFPRPRRPQTDFVLSLAPAASFCPCDGGAAFLRIIDGFPLAFIPTLMVYL